MNQKTKMIIAVVGFVLAAGVLVWWSGLVTPKVGASVEATATCPKCGYSEGMKMSEVFSRGSLDTGKGWVVKCPKCGTLMPARRNGVVAEQRTGQ